MVHIQDIFKYMDIEGKIDYSKLNHKQKKALRNIIECKTEIMGFNTDICECCGHTEIHYNSCKNPNCPEAVLLRAADGRRFAGGTSASESTA